jgi:PAS domain S-box-containing protein
VEILPEAVGLVDAHGQFLSVNPQAAKMLGYPDAHSLLAKNVFDLTPPEHHERVRADMAIALTAGRLRDVGHAMVRKDGTRFPVEVSATAVKDGHGQTAGLLLVVRDVSERRRAEERIGWLSHILDQAHDAIVVRDLDGRIEYFNQGAERMLGWKASEVRGRRPMELFFDDTSQFERAQEKLLRQGSWSGELQVRTKAGEPLVVHSRWTLVQGPKGASPHVVVINADITERKRAEEELRLLPRRIIEAQEAELQRVARDLHDSVNQIIAAARMQLRSIEFSVAASSPASSKILDHCDQLLEQALEENRHIAHNLRPRDLDRFGLAEACRNFCEQFQARTNLALKSQIGRLNGHLPPAMQLNLFRIVQEALANAEKHAHAKSIRLRLDTQGEAIQLTIQDDGCGFDPAAAKTGKPKLGGLGLTNMRERAAALGGYFEVESAPGRGTTITVRIPLGRSVTDKPVEAKAALCVAQQIHLPFTFPSASASL